MIVVEPKQCVADEKALHLIAAVIENEAGPLRMIALPRIGVFIKMGAIEKTQTVLIVGKVRGDPVENDTDPMLMENIDEVHKVLRRAVISRGREVAGNLITPGAEKGMVHDGQQLHVRIPQANQMLGQLRRQLPIGKRAIVLFGLPPPGADMHFINADGLIQAWLVGGASSIVGRPIHTQDPKR